MVKRKIAQISAAALGYIHGNLRGAYLGYKLAGKVTKNSAMPKTPPRYRGRRPTPYTPPSGGTSRTLTNTPRARKGSGVNRITGSRRLARKVVLKRKSVPVRMKIPMSVHNDMSIRTISIKYPFQGHKGKTLGKFYYRETYQEVIEGAQGQQVGSILKAMLTLTQLQGATTSTTRSNESSWNISPYELNPFSVPPSNPLYTNTTTALASADSYKINNVEVTVKMLSLRDVPQHVKLYYVVNKNSSAFNAYQIWENGVTRERYGQTIGTAASLLATTTATSGYNVPTNPGEVPTRVRMFRDHFKILKEYQVILQPGDQHHVRCNIQLDRFFTKEYLQQLTTSDVYIRGTIQILAVVIPSVVGMSTASPPTKTTEVAYGEVKVGFVQEMKYTFAALPQSRIHTSRSWEGLVTNDTTDKQLKIDDEDDVDEAEDA